MSNNFDVGKNFPQYFIGDDGSTLTIFRDSNTWQVFRLTKTKNGVFTQTNRMRASAGDLLFVIASCSRVDKQEAERFLTRLTDELLEIMAPVS